MLTIEKRIAALEKSNGNDTEKIIFLLNDEETHEQALARMGLPPDAHVRFFDTIDAMV